MQTSNMKNGKVELKSTIPGLEYPTWRDHALKTAFRFMEGRRQIDGAEGLWRIDNSLYDLENFAKKHPGGTEWITLTKGTDITELFESHHISDKAMTLLPKFYVREASSPRAVPWTLKPDGFYRTFKKRAREALKNVDYHHSAPKTKIFADLLATSAVLCSLMAASTQSYLGILVAGVFLLWTTVIAHNYFHMRNNFRMYYFDLCLMSSKDWRISHAMSHHPYPNTLWDFEIYTAEPFLKWHPFKDKNMFTILLSQLLSPFYWSLLIADQAIKRYYSVFFEYRSFEFRDFVPFILPLSMMYVAPSIIAALKTWILIILVTSCLFGFVGFNAAHHHPEIFHDGDTYRDDLDWGLLELDAVREREVIDDNDFLALTNFGLHGLHHLLPTVDHTYLPLCYEAFKQTCEDFGISTKRSTPWKMIKGQFEQLARSESRKNHR